MDPKAALRDWRVPRLRLEQFHKEIEDEIRKAADDVLFQGHWQGLTKNDELEKKFAEWIGAKYCLTTASGSASLQLALQGCGIGPGDEVIVPANSDMANYNAIEITGAAPVLCDVLESDYTIDVRTVEPLINEKTKAIMPIDIYGHPCDMEPVRALADKYGLYVVEDAALSSFSKDKGRNMGVLADVAIFSTAATKTINGCAFGGFVTTDNEEIIVRAEKHRAYGLDLSMVTDMPDISNHAVTGYNVRMHPMDAAVFLAKMPYLDRFRAARKDVVGWYEKYLAEIPGVVLPTFRPESEPVMREYVPRVITPAGEENLRNRVFRHLVDNGVQASLNYTPYVPARAIGKKRNYKNSENLPVCKLLSDQLISLPCDPLLTEDEIQMVCALIGDVMNK